MADGAVAPPVFDAVLVVHPASDTEIAGLRLLERAAFSLVRAGARRLLCVGPRLRGPLRMPPLASEWIESVDELALATWLTSATPSVVGMDGATVVDAATIAALAADPREVLLAADGLPLLWRAPRALAARALACAVTLATTSSPAAHPSGVTAGFPTLPEATAWARPAGGLVYPVRDAVDAHAVTVALFARLGRPGDGWFARLVDRRISRALTRLLLPTGVTPNQVTIASIAVGLVAAALFALGSSPAVIAGSLLFLASTIVDGCDGELARLTFRESRFGARLDVIGDNIVHVFLFGGIAAGLYRRGHDPRIAVAGGLLVVGVMLAIAAAYAYIVRREPTPRQRTLFETFASREFAYLLVALSVAGKLEWFLWASAVGTYAFVGGLLLLRR